MWRNTYELFALFYVKSAQVALAEAKHQARMRGSVQTFLQ